MFFSSRDIVFTLHYYYKHKKVIRIKFTGFDDKTVLIKNKTDDKNAYYID